MKRKVIKILFIFILILTVYLIYNLFKTNKINYISLGDSLSEGMSPYGKIDKSYSDYLAELLDKKNQLNYYTKKYSKSGFETIDIINEIRTSGELKKDLRESDLVTVTIGANDFIHNNDIKDISINNINDYKKIIKPIIKNVDNSIKEIRKYAKEKIIIVGYYNPFPKYLNNNIYEMDSLFSYIDDEYYKIAKKYKCIYIPMYKIFKNNPKFLPNPIDIHPNLEGYNEIAKIILSKI